MFLKAWRIEVQMESNGFQCKMAISLGNLAPNQIAVEILKVSRRETLKAQNRFWQEIVVREDLEALAFEKKRKKRKTGKEGAPPWRRTRLEMMRGGKTKESD